MISPEDVEIQVLEDRLEKLIEGMNLIRNEWVKVHGKQNKIKRIDVKYWPGIPQTLKDVKLDKSFGDMEELSDKDLTKIMRQRLLNLEHKKDSTILTF